MPLVSRGHWDTSGPRIPTEHVSDLEALTPRFNDYSKNIGITSNWEALLLNKVVVGNGKELAKGDTSLTQPPPGFDSVCHQDRRR